MQTSYEIYYRHLARYKRMRASLLRCIATERADGLVRGPKYLQSELAKLRRGFYGMAV